jgi:aspartate racemase
MKTLGIIGGIGPESTIEYYRFILNCYRTRVPDGSAPHLLIDSLDVNRAIALLDANDLAGLTNYISFAVGRLTSAGAEILLTAANTPHLVFDQVQARAAIPILRMVQAACDEARCRGYKRLGLFGTGFTMEARFYPETFARAGLELLPPNESERALLHEKYIHELLQNEFRPETRRLMLDIIERMRREDGIEALLLAGTELPLLFRGAEPAGLPFLDTTLIQVRAAVTAILGDAGLKSD